LSATGYSFHRDKYSPLVPNYYFVPYNNIEEIKKIIGNEIAAIIVEPIQGEGGINVPSDDYLVKLSELCQKNGVYLILDEIQTGFFRTGTFFCSSPYDIKVDFMTMAKGIAGGFPFGAFAITEEISKEIEIGDHGGTYCGNPLGCAVAYAVVRYLFENNISDNVNEISKMTFEILHQWKIEFPEIISDIRGKGLLIAIEMKNDNIVSKIRDNCLDDGLILNTTRGNVIRLFPALNITKDEMEGSLRILKNSIMKSVKNDA
jgi:acetylornithine/N-succinyldiaminopimelate aminotransferase